MFEGQFKDLILVNLGIFQYQSNKKANSYASNLHKVFENRDKVKGDEEM